MLHHLSTPIYGPTKCLNTLPVSQAGSRLVSALCLSSLPLQEHPYFVPALNIIVIQEVPEKAIAHFHLIVNQSLVVLPLHHHRRCDAVISDDLYRWKAAIQ